MATGPKDLRLLPEHGTIRLSVTDSEKGGAEKEFLPHPVSQGQNDNLSWAGADKTCLVLED